MRERERERERNEKYQSEIHAFSIFEKDGSLNLNYRNQTLIQHQNTNYRYSGLSIDKKNKRFLCLKSYHVKGHPKLDEFEVNYILFDSLTRGKTNPNMLISLTKEVLFMRNSFATNLEGIYSDNESIFVTSNK